MKGRGNNQDNLDDIYSDLSDEDRSRRKKSSSVSPKPSKNQPASIIKGPGGRAFVPPPPPPTSKPLHKSTIPEQILQSRSHPQGHHHPPGNQNMRERKSTIYIKNIPKSCNRQQTLTTFFRTFGNIKSIKTYQQQHSAAVRFERQQDAHRFMTNKPLILNRSYILYDTNEDFVVPAASVQQREKDEVVVVNASQRQLIILKENSETAIADKYRCLLYLNKYAHKLTSEQQDEVRRQMQVCKKIRGADSSDRELGDLLLNFENDYDWTLTYKIKTKEMIDKKKKYGPIGIISAKIYPMTTNDPSEAKSDEKIGVIKIKHLALRSCWQMYSEKCECLGLEIEGKKLNVIFKAWLAKKNEQQVASTNEVIKKEVKEERDQENKAITSEKPQISLEAKQANKPEAPKQGDDESQTNHTQLKKEQPGAEKNAQEKAGDEEKKENANVKGEED